MTVDSPTPCLVAAPGMTLAAVVARSMTRIRTLHHLDGVHHVQPSEPHRLVVPGPGDAVTTEAGRFTMIRVVDGVVAHLRSCPQLAYLALDPAMTLLERLAAAFDLAGWRQVTRFSAAHASIQALHAGSSIAGRWRADDLHCELMLRRVHPADGAVGQMLGLKHDLYLVPFDVRTALR